MRIRALLLIIGMACGAPFAGAQDKSGGVNPAIDMKGYLRVAEEAAQHETRRLSEEDFIRMAGSRAPSSWTRGARRSMTSSTSGARST